MAFCPNTQLRSKSAIFTPKRDDGHLRLLHMRAPAGPVFQSTIILPPVDCLECHFVLSSLDLGGKVRKYFVLKLPLHGLEKKALLKVWLL